MQASFGFDTVQLEGSLFVADQLEKAMRGDAAYQKPEDYHIPMGLRLTDEQGRAFQTAIAQWKHFMAPDSATAGNIDQRTEAFVIGLFRDALGYIALHRCEPPQIGESRYPISFMACDAVPLIIAPKTLSLDTPDSHFVIENSGKRKNSPTQLAQEYLNALGSGWAIVSNGALLRLLRASPSLVRPSWLEFDLETIFEESRYADFCVLYRIMHASRAAEIWEAWRTEGIEQGVRVREGLRTGVTQALVDLGSGFLSYDSEGNQQLREALYNGSFTKEEYFKELLRLIYRFLFLFTTEERGILHASSKNEKIIEKDFYARGYSLSRLKDKAIQRSGWNAYPDLWEGCKTIFRCLDRSEPALDLPALGGLFSQSQCPHLDRAQLSNRNLLSAMLNLRWAVAGNSRLPVDYKNIGPEELGSVYESLLELVPDIDFVSRSLSFVGIDREGAPAGNVRKTTGSYYTPEPLVQELLKTALYPVIDELLKGWSNGLVSSAEAEKSLLGLKVCDPACGSGHFLLGAGRRIAEKLALVRSLDGSVLPADYRSALREVIGHCLYGVDVNPMAVELAKTALWLEGHEPGKPLSFLDHHIRCGNSLIGVFDVEVLAKGIPDEAYTPLSGDDIACAKAQKKANLSEREQGWNNLYTLFEEPVEQAEKVLVRFHQNLETLDEADLAAVEHKRKLYAELATSPEYQCIKEASDLWTGAFFAPKKQVKPAIHTGDVWRALAGSPESEFSEGVLALAQQLSAQHHFFHWKLEFPEVFAKGGFDCVLGNPPWDVSQLNEIEFFGARSQEIANLLGENRKRAIAMLKHDDPILWNEFSEQKRIFESFNQFVRLSERFRLSTKGKTNLYVVFSELFLDLHTKHNGRAGLIVPSGIATDDSTKDFFGAISRKGLLVSLYDFENRLRIFPDIDSRIKFCLLSMGAACIADFAFFLTTVEQLGDERRHFSLSPEDFELLNPNTYTCPVFRSQKDAEITRKIYKSVPILIREVNKDKESHKINPWDIAFRQGLFNMTSDSAFFHTSSAPGLMPLYEAKLIHQFDHRWATYSTPNVAPGEEPRCRDLTDEEKRDPRLSIQPRYWVEEREVFARIADAPKAVIKAWRNRDILELRKSLREPGIPQQLAALADSSDLLAAVGAWLEAKSPRWLMGWRDITNATNERTVIASVLPRAGVGHKLPLFVTSKKEYLRACKLANMNCLAFDFIARTKLGGTDLTYSYLKQLPVLSPEAYSPNDLAFIIPRVFALTYTAYDIAGWAEDLWNSLDTNIRARVYRRSQLEDNYYRRMSEPEIHQRGIAQDEAAAPQEPFYLPDSFFDRSFSTEFFPPFPWSPERRAVLRAELDAYYARLYGLDRDELRYILDPKDVMGADYPSETFRVLKNNELKAYGEYRTQRLVLAAWDALEKGELT